MRTTHQYLSKEKNPNFLPVLSPMEGNPHPPKTSNGIDSYASGEKGLDYTHPKKQNSAILTSSLFPRHQ